MAITIGQDFELFEARGVQVLRPRKRLGEQEEAQRLAKTLHALRARLGQRALLPRDATHDPYETTSLTDVTVYEVEVQASKGRYGGAATGVSYTIEGEQAVITLQAIDRDDNSTVLASATASPVLRATSTGTFDPGVKGFILRVLVRAAPAQTAKIYRVRIQERALTDTADLDLEGFVALDDARFGSDSEGYGVLEAHRWVDQLTTINEQQMITGSFALRVDRPEVCGAVEVKHREWIRWISPEADELLTLLRYRVTGPGVEVRWSLGLRGQTAAGHTEWQTLSSSGDRRTHQDQVSLQPAHSAGLSACGVVLEVRSTVSDDPADEFTYTVKTGGIVNSGATLELDQDPTSDFYTLECAQVKFFTGATEIETEVAYQIQRFDASKVTLYPYLNEDINGAVDTIKVTRAGTLEIYGVHTEEIHGTPYRSRGRRFLWNNKTAAKAALAPDSPLGAAPHLLMYGAAEYLLSDRLPLWAWGSCPNNDADTTHRAFAQRNLGPGTDAADQEVWQTLAQCPVGDDWTLGRVRSGVVSRHERRALEVYASVIISSNRASRSGENTRDNDPVPLEFRLRRRLADGTETAVSDGQRLDAVSANVPGSYTLQTDGPPSGKEQRSATNLQGVRPRASWGADAYPVVLDITDVAATEGEVLEIQVRAIGGDELSLNREGGQQSERCRISLTSWAVRPYDSGLWSQVVVDL